VTPEIINSIIQFSAGNNNMLSQKFTCETSWSEWATNQWIPKGKYVSRYCSD